MRLIGILAIILTVLMLGWTHAFAEIMTYDLWKHQRVSQAKMKYERILQERKKEGGLSPETNSRLKKARTNLVIAEELTANDYFQHYLSPMYGGQVKALQAVVKKMKPSDVAEILMAYSAQLKDLQQAPAAPPTGWMSETDENSTEKPNLDIGAAKQ